MAVISTARPFAGDDDEDKDGRKRQRLPIEKPLHGVGHQKGADQKHGQKIESAADVGERGVHGHGTRAQQNHQRGKKYRGKGGLREGVFVFGESAFPHEPRHDEAGGDKTEVAPGVGRLFDQAIRDFAKVAAHSLRGTHPAPRHREHENSEGEDCREEGRQKNEFVASVIHNDEVGMLSQGG